MNDFKYYSDKMTQNFISLHFIFSFLPSFANSIFHTTILENKFYALRYSLNRFLNFLKHMKFFMLLQIVFIRQKLGYV